MTLPELRTLYEEMLAADQAYKKADPLEVHHAYAALRAARFRYNRACGAWALLGALPGFGLVWLECSE